MGGTVHKFAPRFRNASYVVLCSCAEYPPNKGIEKELHASAEMMGVKEMTLMDFPWMEFQSVRGEIRQFLFGANRKLRPDLVFIPSKGDVHQDHEVLSQEAFRIFRDVSVVAYEVVRSTLTFSPTLFVGLRKEDMDAKLRLLRVYRTQKRLYYFQPHLVRALAITRGAHSRERYAEAFEVMRLKA